MDTVFIVNQLGPREDLKNTAWIQKCNQLLDSVHGQSTRRGKIQVLRRPNVGLSFGAYNYCFEQLESQYDFWLFTEDDQICLVDGYLLKAIEQLSVPNVGFVAFVGVSTDPNFAVHAHGGVGLSRREILSEVKKNNKSKFHKDGHLPYHPGEGYTHQSELGEVRFTNAIAKLGYKLVNLEMENALVSWRDTKRRTPRMTPWIEEYAKVS